MALQQVQYIACINEAAFVMNFSIQYLESDGNWKTSEWNSGNYPVGRTVKSPDLASLGVPADAIAITPYVHAILGVHNTGTPMVTYAANGQTASYKVSGTTLSYSVTQV